MAHQSVDNLRLKISIVNVESIEKDFPDPTLSPKVWLFILPYSRTIDDAKQSDQWNERLREFAKQSHSDSVICILTTPADAANTWLKLEHLLKYQLWIAVKLKKTIECDGKLPEHHAALLILTKYHNQVKHAKTRIQYTYCPACDKTTKDYGGKKHTYHEYGTLMSDVWRDIEWNPSSRPKAIINRLADMFGVTPLENLRIVSLDQCPALQPKTTDKINLRPKSRSRKLRYESQLLQGNCLSELANITTSSADFCFADPPYNLAKKYDNWDDDRDIIDYFEWCDQWLSELARILKPGRTCAVMNIPQRAIRHLRLLMTKLRFQNWICWEGLSLPVRMIMPAHYAILCFSKGAPRPLPGLIHEEMTPLEGESLCALKEWYCVRQSCVRSRPLLSIEDRQPVTDLWWDIHRLKHNTRRVDHPCQLPPALMRRLISLFSYEEEIVVDPFNGAGTTTLCAEQLGRTFIGIELSEIYHQLAQQRHLDLGNGYDPFAKVKRNLKAKNSRVQRIGGFRYAVPKKTLQLDVKEIAQRLGHIPSRGEVMKNSKYPINYFDEYFISWAEVCAAARTTGMTEDRKITTIHTEQLQLFK